MFIEKIYNIANIVAKIETQVKWDNVIKTCKSNGFETIKPQLTEEPQLLTKSKISTKAETMERDK